MQDSALMTNSLRNLSATFLLATWIPTLHGFELSGNFWEFGQATFHVGINGVAPSGSSWNEAFKRALDAWSNATAFEFSVVDEFLDPCIGQVDPGGFGDNITGVDFTDTVCGTEFNENVLAVTLTAGTCMNQSCTGGFHITDADIVFNSSENWDIYSGPLRFDNTTDFERVALHELGHAIGLRHTSASIDAIMQPFVSAITTLQADDIAGANAIYGQEATLSTVYGIDIVLPNSSIVSGPSDSISFNGSLSNSDADLDGKFLDLFQYSFDHDSRVDIRLNSSTIDTFLYFARVTSTQDIIDAFTFFDDNSGTGLNSHIVENIQAGTYWLGASSSGSAEVGDYDVAIITSTNSLTPSFETFTSIYGVDVEINPNPKITGSLSNSDFLFEEKFLDLYQFDVLNTTNLQFDLSSTQLNPKLFVVQIMPNQFLGSIMLENDNSSLFVTNSRIKQSLPPGTYWIGVTSSGIDDTGDYSIDISVIIP